MKLRAAVLDWAGTTVDFGCLAPVHVLRELFAKAQVPLSDSEARAYMGLLKRDHIEKTLTIPRVRSAWIAQHGTAPDDTVVARLFADFIPMQLDCLAEHSTLIPGVLKAVAAMRARGLKIGGTTGYTRPMLDLLLEKAKTQGFVLDCALCPEDVGGGRPHAWMIYENAVRMRVEPMAAIVKIGDTESDIEEGRNAGTWTVGVVKTGNMIGLSEMEWEALPESEQQNRLAEGRERLLAAGADYVIDMVGQIEGILDRIEERLEKGERP